MSTQEQQNENKSLVYFDLTCDGKPKGRVIFKLYDDIVPKTTKNFRTLCSEENKHKNSPISGKPLSYKNSIFHRVIKDFMCQGGDFTHGTGIGGESVYENFDKLHDKPFLLSMANAGPNTNGSQFFITTVPTPHLNGKHVVFGELIQGKSIIRQMERSDKDSNDKPVDEWKIEDCGELPADYVLNDNPDDGTGDEFEEILKDNDVKKVDINDPNSVINAVTKIKDIGTKLLKEGKLKNSMEKYSKAVNYLDDYFPEDLSNEKISEINKLKISCLLNLSLVSLKLKNGKKAIKAANDALHTDLIDDKSKVKALYRKGSGYLLIKDEENAELYFKEAFKLEPNDPAIKKGLEDVKLNIKKRKEQQKKSMSKFFK
ncbi:CPR6 [Candida pseudojiufengensis]|uniref:CPR6 n=1 Tax=Candida pseudojiufengensis TaxID=497109 RepID=UPI002224A140|nr:CPR6 [Candida pseudojiufengensis]KAI5961812.1 CPR6 [Candida pseudojiufengensis]